VGAAAADFTRLPGMADDSGLVWSDSEVRVLQQLDKALTEAIWQEAAEAPHRKKWLTLRLRLDVASGGQYLLS